MVDSLPSMYRLWLIFAQTATIAVAALFVVSTFRPEWLPTRASPTLLLPQSAPPAAPPGARATLSYSDAVQRATPSVVNIFTSKEIRAPRHPASPGRDTHRNRSRAPRD